MKPFDFIVTHNLSDEAYIARPWFEDQTLELSRSLARAGFKTLLIEIHPWDSQIEGLGQLETNQGGVWGSLQTLKILAPKPGFWEGPLKFVRSFALAKLVKEAVAKQSSRLTTIIVTGPEGAHIPKLKRKKRLVYFQAPDVKWPRLVEKDWASVSTWVKTLLQDPRRVAHASTIHRSFEVIASSHKQLQVLQANFYIPPHKGKVVPACINPLVSKNLQYEDRGQTSLLFVSENPMASGLDTLLAAWASQSLEWKLKHPLVVVSRILESSNLYQAISDLQTQGLEYVPIDEIDHSGISELILQSRLVVIPSRVEEFGGFQLWALSLGANLLTTMVGGLVDVIGEEAIVIEHDNVSQLQDALVRVLSEEVKETLYERRREFAWENFDSQARANKFVELFQAPERIAGASLP